MEKNEPGARITIEQSRQLQDWLVANQERLHEEGVSYKTAAWQAGLKGLKFATADRVRSIALRNENWEFRGREKSVPRGEQVRSDAWWRGCRIKVAKVIDKYGDSFKVVDACRWLLGMRGTRVSLETLCDSLRLDRYAIRGEGLEAVATRKPEATK